MRLNNFLLKRLILDEQNSLSLTVVIILSIVLGQIIIIVTISIMNGFQNDFFISISTLESGNLKIESKLNDQELNALKEIKEIIQINKIYETQGIGIENYYYPSILNIIAFDTKDIIEDKNFILLTGLTESSLQLNDDEIIIGDVLSHNLGLFEGDTIGLILSDEIKNLQTLKNNIKNLKIKAIFKSKYSKINESTVFMNINYFYRKKIIKDTDINYQIKTQNLYPSKRLTNKIKNINPNIQFKSWNEYNKEFYKTLKIERNTMLIILTSIFLVIAVNTYYLQKRIIINKNKSIAIILFLGLKSKKIRQVFLMHSVIICTLGGMIGLIAGVIISLNINEILNVFDILINSLINSINYLLKLKLENIEIKIVKNIITPKIFPSDLILTLFFVCLFTICSSLKVTKKIKYTDKINGAT
ncbi:ABC transporter permease [Borrelia miyamotoi]|uniref:ABC transporter permease n=1 Tax=Borrelia miyamotoi TaxID=47466 RepID=A0AAX3JMR3_9SPIR|nr:ABC transporter permease [Borrelia miyamotoi]QFP42217.1 ABC transporter permease [Borrelia miyamotoi]QFP48331.1 ABC transporter permease [Borrelia miyamotoi]QGT56092.1 FtsX-like permease family protein [Borrelia miyamotoi]QGT56872.1 FtsX-like permease family protein [Borrelia miyamotoi]WAZ72136.1 ABC transporter permease [Borrelia miyamotoi]